MSLIKKYEPQTIDDIILDEKIMDKIIEYFNGWIQGFPNLTKPSILLYGKPGTGKTLISRCICRDVDFNLIEINASSSRRSEDLKRLLNIPSIDFFGRKICVFLDEIDSSEKGGEAVIKKAIIQMKYPVIMAANDLKKVPKSLRDISEQVQFFRPSEKSLKQFVIKINHDEGLNLPIDVIEAASKTQDYRAMWKIIEARQVLIQKDRSLYPTEITKMLFTHQEVKLPETYSTKDMKTRGSIMNHINENAPKIYNFLDTYEIYEILNIAEKYRKRGQFEFMNNILKTIPKYEAEIEEIKTPLLYEKRKLINTKEQQNDNSED